MYILVASVTPREAETISSDGDGQHRVHRGCGGETHSTVRGGPGEVWPYARDIASRCSPAINTTRAQGICVAEGKPGLENTDLDEKTKVDVR
jgi:hypothetical protein